MSDLQTAFYVIGIVYMSIMLIITLILVAAVIVIRNKIAAIHRQVEEKLDKITDWADKGSSVIGAIKKVAHSQQK